MDGFQEKVRFPFALLLRKVHEIRKLSSAHTLLDLGEHTQTEDVQRAFRTLATQLHPDRLVGVAPAPLVNACSEVFKELNRAKTELLKGKRLGPPDMTPSGASFGLGLRPRSGPHVLGVRSGPSLWARSSPKAPPKATYLNAYLTERQRALG